MSKASAIARSVRSRLPMRSARRVSSSRRSGTNPRSRLHAGDDERDVPAVGVDARRVVPPRGRRTPRAGARRSTRYREGHVTGIPFLYPWANRLGARTYRVGRTSGRASPTTCRSTRKGCRSTARSPALPFDVERVGHRRRPRHPRRCASTRRARAQPRVFDVVPVPARRRDRRHRRDRGGRGRHHGPRRPATSRSRSRSDGTPTSSSPAGGARRWELRLPPRHARRARRPPARHRRVDPRARSRRAPIGRRRFDDHYALGADHRFEIAGSEHRLTVVFGRGLPPTRQVYVPPRHALRVHRADGRTGERVRRRHRAVRSGPAPPDGPRGTPPSRPGDRAVRPRAGAGAGTADVNGFTATPVLVVIVLAVPVECESQRIPSPALRGTPHGRETLPSSPRCGRDLRGAAVGDGDGVDAVGGRRHDARPRGRRHRACRRRAPRRRAAASSPTWAARSPSTSGSSAASRPTYPPTRSATLAAAARRRLRHAGRAGPHERRRRAATAASTRTHNSARSTTSPG